MSGYRLWVVLVAIAVTPLAGVGWFATNDVIDARDERERAERVNAAGQRLVALSELRTQLLNERNWETSARGMDLAGLPAGQVVFLLGIDVPGERDRAAANVDVLIAAVGQLLADVVASRGLDPWSGDDDDAPFPESGSGDSIGVVRVV